MRSNTSDTIHVNFLRAFAAGLVAVLLPPTASATRLPRSGSTAAEAADQSSGVWQANTPTKSESMSNLLRTLGGFKSFAMASSVTAEQAHENEQQRLHRDIEQSPDEGVKLALSQSVTSSQESLRETKSIYSNMITFAGSMISLLKATTTKGYGCELVSCGAHASCTETTKGAECVCKEGYVGAGRDCRPPPAFMPHNLLYEGTQGTVTHTADIDIHAFDTNKIAVVFRDRSKQNIGRLVVGKVREAGMADLTPPEQFTTPSGRAYNPVVAGTSDKRIAIVWRDEKHKGSCWIIGATLGATGVRGADLAVNWGTPVNFCAEQSHKMSILAFPNSRITVMFSDKLKATDMNPGETFGNAILAEITSSGAIGQLGSFRFSDYGVCRLDVVKVSSNAFVLGARAVTPLVDEMDPSIATRQEAMAVYGEVVGNDIMFDANPVNLEPVRTKIWARGLSLIAPNTVAYAYQDGKEGKLKMSVLEINPLTHRMKVLDGPVIVRSVNSPYVSMISMPYTASDPHTLIYYEGDGASMVNLCSWSASSKKLERCEDFSWLSNTLTSVSGVNLGFGKSFMVFTTKNGMPYYSVFGLSKK